MGIWELKDILRRDGTPGTLKRGWWGVVIFLGKTPQGMYLQGPGLYWGGVKDSTFKAGGILRRRLG